MKKIKTKRIKKIKLKILTKWVTNRLWATDTTRLAWHDMT